MSILAFPGFLSLITPRGEITIVQFLVGVALLERMQIALQRSEVQRFLQTHNAVGLYDLPGGGDQLDDFVFRVPFQLFGG
jgi:hypothetical protein